MRTSKKIRIRLNLKLIVNTAPKKRLHLIPRLHLKLTNQIVWMIKTKTNKNNNKDYVKT